MAKSDSILGLRGTIGDLTFVKSRAYGDHLRAKRGTYKKAVVNEALKQESKTLISANIPAKIIKDAIDPYRGNFVGGTFWQRLVSLFRRQLKESRSIDFGKIGQFEVHEDHPFQRFLSIQPTIEIQRKAFIHIDVKYDHHPKFKVKGTDGYRLTVIGIFPDLKKKSAKTIAIESGVMKLTGAIPPLPVQFAIPPRAKSFIICIRIEGCEKDKVVSMRGTTGLQIIASGSV
jgi:hypothetical protein